MIGKVHKHCLHSTLLCPPPLAGLQCALCSDLCCLRPLRAVGKAHEAKPTRTPGPTVNHDNLSHTDQRAQALGDVAAQEIFRHSNEHGQAAASATEPYTLKYSRRASVVISCWQTESSPSAERLVTPPK